MVDYNALIKKYETSGNNGEIIGNKKQRAENWSNESHKTYRNRAKLFTRIDMVKGMFPRMTFTEVQMMEIERVLKTKNLFKLPYSESTIVGMAAVYVKLITDDKHFNRYMDMLQLIDVTERQMIKFMVFMSTH